MSTLALSIQARENLISLVGTFSKIMAFRSNLHAQPQAVADENRRLIAASGRAVVVIDGSLPASFFAGLVGAADIDWTLVIVFLAGEWLGVKAEAKGSLRRQIIEHLLMRVPIVEFHAPRGEAANPRAVVSNYAQLFTAKHPDLAVLGSFAESSANDLESSHETMPVALVEITGRKAIALTAAAWRQIPLVLWVGDDR
jgi:hypothetical protein